MKKTLKELRTERGMTQLEVAAALKMDSRVYRKYENGELTMRGDKLQAVAIIFGVSSDDIDLMVR